MKTYGSAAARARSPTGDVLGALRRATVTVWLVLSTVGIYVQLTADAAEALAGGTALVNRFRRTGIGRVRKDLSTPLEPAADRVWIQALHREALLVWRRDTGPDHAAFFRLGQLSPGARTLADSFGRVQVLFVIASDVLPQASFATLQQLVEQQGG